MTDFGPDDSQNPINPFAAPASLSPTLGVASEGGEIEIIRRKHLKHEKAIKSFGALFYIGGAFTLFLFGIPILALKISALFISDLNGGPPWNVLLLGGISILLGSSQIYVAQGLRRLKASGRSGATLLGGLGLLAFPIGTLIGPYLLYLLWSEKGQLIFSPKYQDILEATPHIVHKTSILAWILLGIIVIFFAIGLAGFSIG